MWKLVCFCIIVVRGRIFVCGNQDATFGQQPNRLDRTLHKNPFYGVVENNDNVVYIYHLWKCHDDEHVQ